VVQKEDIKSEKPQTYSDLEDEESEWTNKIEHMKPNFIGGTSRNSL